MFGVHGSNFSIDVLNLNQALLPDSTTPHHTSHGIIVLI